MLRPTGFVDSPFGHDGKVARLAGGLNWFANVELLTIQVRLLVCSIDKAEQIGMNWWRHDPRLTTSTQATLAAGELDDRLARIERALEQLTATD